MTPFSRAIAPWLFAAGALAAVVWALNQGSLPRADFTFVNGSEVKSLDPSIVTGQPEQRMLTGLFEGLMNWHPRTLEPIPGVANRWELSEDRRTYTLHLRPDAKWSDGSPVTAEDFAYSLRRLLDPRTAAEYAYQAWYILGARRYSSGGRALNPGDAIEVELNLPPDAVNTLRGEVRCGRLLRIEDSSGRELSDAEREAAQGAEGFRIEAWTFVVDCGEGAERYCYADDDSAAKARPAAGVRWCRQVLPDFRTVGVAVIDERTLRIELENPTPYFLTLLGYYPLFPVNRRCVERYGSPQWTYVENIVCNGAYVPEFRRIRDRTRLRKNPHYWNRDEVRLETIDVLAVESSSTALNLYLTDQVDWIYDLPAPALKTLLAERPRRPDVNPQPMLVTYFYMLNTTRKPLDDVRVRRALAMAIDRRELTDVLLGAGERPAYSLTPPGIAGYVPPQCPQEDAAKARRLLAEAGYPDGRGFPPMSILYNTHEGHQAIAELIRKQWQNNLGIALRTRNEEFATLLASQRQMNYDVSRRGWVGDYPDPNTFLDLHVTGGEQNGTGWSNAEYDALIGGGW
jgi:oligopeptide transport system substrate-binding protein